MKLIDAVKLMRPWQWYKNLVIFIPLVFSQNLTNFTLWPILLTGFAVLCLVSSASYALNDIFDAKSDRRHPEKRRRPIASGRVGVGEAVMLVAAIGVVAALLSSTTNLAFSIFAMALFLSNLAYSAYLKEVPLVDLHVISINFVLRVVSGAFIIDLGISPWLIVVVFLLAIFLATGKRRAEFEKFGQQRLKPVFRFYSTNLLNRLTDISAAMLLISYILYTAFAHDAKLMFTIPLATFLVFRYLYFIYSESEVARKTERVFLDAQMLAGIVVWVILSVLVIYVL